MTCWLHNVLLYCNDPLGHHTSIDIRFDSIPFGEGLRRWKDILYSLFGSPLADTLATASLPGVWNIYQQRNWEEAWVWKCWSLKIRVKPFQNNIHPREEMRVQDRKKGRGEGKGREQLMGCYVLSDRRIYWLGVPSSVTDLTGLNEVQWYS